MSLRMIGNSALWVQHESLPKMIWQRSRTQGQEIWPDHVAGTYGGVLKRGVRKRPEISLHKRFPIRDRLAGWFFFV